MKKSVAFLALILCFLAVVSAFASAANIEIKKTDKGSVILAGQDDPAVFDLEITNNGPKDTFEIYSFVGVSFTPKGLFELPTGTTKMTINAYPSAEVRKTVHGLFNFEYQMLGTTSGIFKDTMTIKIVSIKDAIKITPKPIRYGNTNANIEIENLENMNINNLKLVFDSIFFKEEKTISLAPNAKISVSLNIINAKMQEIPAGSYVVTVEASQGDESVIIDSTVNYLEKQSTSIKKETSGFLIRTTKLTKGNEGNTPISDKIEIKKNVLTRLFTTTSPEPLGVERNGLIVTYEWAKDLKPGEEWSVTYTTNYTYPFLIILIIAFIAVMVYIYGRTVVILQKRVSFVKTSTGDFALKVTLRLKARRAVENIEIVDKVPNAVKIYEKGGMPHRMDAATRRIFWDIERLNAGEERILSYIIYSKINIVGKFELPAGYVKFTRDGKSETAYSNRTYFVSDIYPKA